MAEWKKISLPVTTYLSAHGTQLPPMLAGKLMDCYINRIPVGDGTEIINIHKRPGIELFLNFVTGARIDGAFWWPDKAVLLVASNGKIFRVTTSTGDYTDITGADTLAAGSPVVFATDGDHIVMANGGRMIIYDNADVWSLANKTDISFVSLWSLVEKTDISFDATTKQIRSAAAEFVVAALPVGRTLSVAGSKKNDNTALTVVTATTSVITVSEALIDETAGSDEVTGSDAKIYTCISPHTATTDNKPVTGGDWATYWEQKGSVGGAWAAGTYYSPQLVTIETEDTNIIRSAAGEFATAKFPVGRLFRVTGSGSNDGTYAVVELSADEKEISVNKPMTCEVAGASVTIDMGAPMYVDSEGEPQQVSHVAFLDGYILANKIGTNEWYWCENGDPATWLADSSASAESKPDILLALAVANREIGLFGAESVEFWYNDGTTPFSRLDPVFVERGCYAKHSVQSYLGIWIWIDDRRRVVRMDARSPVPISEPLDDIVRDMNSITDAEAFIIDIGKKAFYVLNFPTEDRTFVYDILGGSWYEWGKWNSTTGLYSRYKGATYTWCKNWGFHIIGDNSTGKIYKMNSDLYQDAGEEIRTVVWTGNITHGSLTWKRSNELLLRLKRGLAAPTQLLTDGGFEAWLSATNLTSWTETIAGTSTVNREASIVQQGTYAVRLDIDASNNNAYISQALTMLQNIEYTLSLWYKNSVAAKTAFVAITDSANNVALQADGTWAAYAVGIFIPLINATDWTRLVLPFKAHPSYSNYTIIIGHTSTRTSASGSSIYFDDARIERPPQLMMRWRNEQQDWSDQKLISIGLGKTGEYNMVQRIQRLGRYRARQYEFVHTDNTDFILEDAEENVDGLR